MSTGGGGGGGGAMPATTGSYPESVDSSPRSRGGDSWTDENYSSSVGGPAAKLRLMCSYGGQIVPRPHDKTLCYVGGETRMVVVDRYNTTLSDLSEKLSRSLISSRPFALKYQLPSEDLDSLISVTTDEDLDNMIDEYDRLLSPSGNDPKAGAGGSSKQNRLRLFLFPSKPDSVASSSSIGSLLDESKSETWFVDALNSAIGISGGDSSVDSLLGLEEERNLSAHGGGDKAEGQVRAQQPQQISQQLDTTSSFGSQSSASGPFPSDLPPIRVRVEEQRFGVHPEREENRIARLSIKPEESTAKEGDSWLIDYGQHHDPSPPPPPPSSVTTVPISAAASTASGFSTCSENLPTSAPRVLASDEDKPVRDGTTSPLQPVDQHQQPVADSSKQDSQNKVSDPSYRIHVPEQGYNTMTMHPEQIQQQQLLQQQLQLQLENQRQLNQQQQYIHANQHFAPQQASTMVVPTQPYYQMPQPIQTQPQLAQANTYNQQIPMYVMPVGQNQSYMIPMQQHQRQGNLCDAAQLVPRTNAPTMPILNPLVPSQSLPVPKPELRPPATAAAGVYRTTAGTASATSQQPPLPPQVIQMGDQAHHQYLGYHSMHHPPSQPAALEGGYGYDSIQPQQPAMYYSQASSMPLPSQYQTMSSTAPAIPEMRPQLQPSNLNQRTGAAQ